MVNITLGKLGQSMCNTQTRTNTKTNMKQTKNSKINNTEKETKRTWKRAGTAKLSSTQIQERTERLRRIQHCTCMTSVTSGCNALKDCSTVIIPLKCGPKHDESPKLFLIIGLTVLQYPGMFSCSNLMLNCFDSWETFTEHSSVPAFFNSNFLPCNMLTSI